jgi:hypothetical protein
MSSKEGAAIARVLLETTKDGWRLFRNTVGQGWTGKAGQVVEGGVYLRNPQRVTFGLCTGSSDLVGWRPLEITADMVGKRVAQFVAVEVKTDSYKSLSPEQFNFLRQVLGSGGLAMVARQDGQGVLFEEFPQFQ